ncbi:MAG: putative metal-binding motif-containing protein [Myxococcota bacterium]|nr:putative metal-binding motif-containing protein [Myxococcota bacterium]
MTLLMLLGASPVMAATLTVSQEGGQDSDSLQEAVDAALDGDTIRVERGEFPTAFVSGKELHVQSSPEVILGGFVVDNGALTLTDATVSGESARIRLIQSTLTLEGVQFVGKGLSQASPAIEAESSTIEARRVSVEDWGWSEGSPVLLNGTTASFSESSFSSNRGLRGGSIAATNSDLSLSVVVFSHSYAAEQGGAVYAANSAVSFEEVKASDVGARAGGVLYLDSGSFVAVASQALRAQSHEGASAFQVHEATSSVSDVKVEQSQGRFGALTVYRGSLDASDLTFHGNEADDGAHLWVGGGASVTLLRSEFSEGLAGRGGAVFVESGAVDVDNAIWSDNASRSSGGALFVEGGAVDVAFAVVADNTSEIGSAVAVSDGSVTLSGIVFQDSSPGDTIANASGFSVQVTDAIFHGAQSTTLGSVSLASVVEGDPGFVGGSWVPGPYSPALDAVAGSVDRDGTVADIGAFGGPQAWTLADADGDGFVWGRDCDDSDAGINEAASDDFYDGIDADCLGNDDYDADGDGYAAANFGGMDCDDVSAEVNPGMAEVSGDRFDQNCDGLLDIDADGDGWAEGVDCDESDPTVHPWAPDTPYDGVDSNCLGDDDYDVDGDGYAYDVDCDDNDPRINPATPELFDDGVDQDCDGYDATTPDSAPVAEAEPERYDPGLDALPWVPGETAEASMGCSSTSGGSRGLPLMGLLAAFGLVFVRRRR